MTSLECLDRYRLGIKNINLTSGVYTCAHVYIDCLLLRYYYSCYCKSKRIQLDDTLVTLSSDQNNHPKIFLIIKKSYINFGFMIIFNYLPINYFSNVKNVPQVNHILYQIFFTALCTLHINLCYFQIAHHVTIHMAYTFSTL